MQCFGTLFLPFTCTLLLIHKISGAILRNDEWREEADLNIGILYSVYDSVNGHCTKEILSGGALSSELVKYRVREINQNPNILPNITLGFIYLDTCGGINTPAERFLKFVPDSCSNSSTSSTSNQVVGIVGPFSSDQSIPTAGLASQYKIPIVSPFATSEELSDKRRFEYFSRLVPPDSFVTQAMTHLLEDYGWTYVQLLYSEGSYAENAAKSIEKNAKKRKICIGHSHRFSGDNPDEYKKVARKVVKYKLARILIVILLYNDRIPFLSELNQIVTNEKFIFLSADDYFRHEGFEHLQDGSFNFVYSLGRDEKFNDYLLSLKPSEAKHNWIRELWENLGHCKFYKNCSLYSNLSETGYNNNNELSYIMKLGDGIELFSRALNDLITSNCPGAFFNKSLLEEFQASSGVHYKFNDRGDLLGEYELVHYKWNNKSWTEENIGSWKKDGDILTINTHFNIESVCSKPCLQTQIRVQQELHCCWLCKECRENEILVKNATECLKCPTFFWPDQETKTKCNEINDDYVEWSDSLSILLIILSGIGVSMNIFVVIMYRVYKEEKIIKASSRFLSGIILFGCSLGYVTVLFFITKPSIVTCVINRIGFHMTICTIYSPLFVKTLRVYRIFKAGSKGNKRPSFFDHLETRLG
ncbi:DgyrCDS7748 [Dimorphilus gyrociliatus]|uniref:DgyrCDS7748 n=1 Tax=Dimorphilus gyrociliatus TaxID=2664684 RepID=A0A7I8VWX8_9ANNE|nr:DgyrCDS7748 [Dimorphilus gyrociliatus]